jgi:glycosyltransferase involved in cell wall biosynthesis
MEETSCLVATSTEEMEHVRRLGYTRPIAVVPNGVNLTDQHRTPAPGRRRVLFLGRLHPIKGLENFLRAWTQVEPSHPDWDLVIAGPEVTPGYRDSLRRLSEELGCRRVRFQAEVSGPEKITLLCQASLLVLPSLSENFGVVVTEALSLGLPVMASSGTPWAGLVSHGCGWWVPLQEEAWVGALHDALGKMETELTQMGNCGREWIRQEFQWSRIAAMMIDLSAWLRNPKGNRPDFVCI